MFLTFPDVARLTGGIKKRVIDFLFPVHVIVQINLEQFIDNVFRFALSLSGNRHLAEELTQECFLRAHQRRTQIKSDLAVKSWLFQILANLWKDYLKKKRIDLVDLNELGLVSGQERPDDQIIRQEGFDGLVRLMQKLPGQQRSVLYLSAVEQLANREISEMLDMTENSVKANLCIARKTMRRKILDQACTYRDTKTS